MALKTVYVKTIGSCNLDCSHCFTNGKNGDPTQFNIDDTIQWIKDYLEKVGEGHAWHFELHGGEPFLVKLHKLKEFTSRVKDIIPDASFGATSNLTFPVTDEHAQFMKDVLCGQLGTSWDPYIRWETDKQYDMWKQSIRTLTDNGLNPKVNVTVTRDLINDYSAKSFIETLVELGVRRVEIERLTMNGSAVCNVSGLFPDNDLQDKWFLELLKYYQLYEVQSYLEIETIDNLLSRLKQNRVNVGTNCRSCEQNLVTINSNGTLATCPNSAEAINYSHITHPAIEFINHDMRNTSQAVEQHYDNRCLTCDVFDLCGGDCHKLNWDNRCSGWKRTLHYLSGRPYKDDLIFKG